MKPTTIDAISGDNALISGSRGRSELAQILGLIPGQGETLGRYGAHRGKRSYFQVKTVIYTYLEISASLTLKSLLQLE